MKGKAVCIAWRHDLIGTSTTKVNNPARLQWLQLQHKPTCSIKSLRYVFLMSVSMKALKGIRKSRKLGTLCSLESGSRRTDGTQYGKQEKEHLSFLSR